jgi:hypothetical protein
MMVPEVIEDEGYEQVLERVAAVDVAKATGMVCARVPHPGRPGKRQTRVREVNGDDRLGHGAGWSPGGRADRAGHPRIG